MASRAFTLLEVLVAIAVFALLLVLLFSVINQSATVWRRHQNDSESYQGARFAFDLIVKNLSQSRMNVYEGYDNPTSPNAYVRKSDLCFMVTPPPVTDFGQGNSVFFCAPANRTLENERFGGLPGLLNSLGYYVTYGKNPDLDSFLDKMDRNRFRLMQFCAPTEEMTAALKNASAEEWFKKDLSKYSTVVADNIICFIVWPRLSMGEDPEGTTLTNLRGGQYRYDSRAGATNSVQPITANQQPPLVQVTLVAIDKQFANRLPDTATVPTEVSSLLTGLFGSASETAFRQDLETLEGRLNSERIGYEIFNTSVPLKESKWSK